MNGMRGDEYEQPSSPPPKKNSNGLLQTIFSSGDTTVKLVTMALIVVTGGGNFLATQNFSKEERDNLRRATAEIHNIEESYQASVRRQKEMRDLLDDINRKLK